MSAPSAYRPGRCALHDAHDAGMVRVGHHEIGWPNSAGQMVPVAVSKSVASTSSPARYRLLLLLLPAAGRPQASTLPCPQQGCQTRTTVEVRPAWPVGVAIMPHQRRRHAVAGYGVVPDEQGYGGWCVHPAPAQRCGAKFVAPSQILDLFGPFPDMRLTRRSSAGPLRRGESTHSVSRPIFDGSDHRGGRRPRTRRARDHS